jgi:hypothetical protein
MGMRPSTAAALVSEYTPPSAKRIVETAGPCLVHGCGGELEVRHERQYGKVYTVCGWCERRVVLVARLRLQLAALRGELDAARKPKPSSRDHFPERNAEIVRRYREGEASVAIGKLFGMSMHAVLSVLRRQGIPRRPRGRPRGRAL